jgi:transposase-like protein
MTKHAWILNYASPDTQQHRREGHRAVKRITNPMPGFKSFWSAQKLIVGIETMHMVKKGQLHCPRGKTMSAAAQFHSFAF